MATRKFSDSDATRIINALDARADRKNKDGALVSTTWGTVGAVDAANKFASAYLYGETDGAYLSEGFRIPETMYLSVGDKVKVAMNYATGDRWISEVNFPPTAYKKVAINVGTGEILQGDGSAPPTAASGVPSGTVVMYGGAAAPSGWLIADGSSVATATYPDLFAVIGYTFGGAGANFNLPNLKSRFPVGLDAANSRWNVMGEVGGAETHTHAGHSAHSNHVFTQPSAHAALTHSAHSGGAVDAHSGTAVSAHSGTAVATHADHVHDTPFIDDDTHTLSTTSAVFGQGSARTRAWTGSFSSASGSYAVARTSGNLTGGTSISHSVTQPSAHTVTDPANHTFTQPSAHSDHASQTHTGGAVDAHSAHSAHDTPASVPPYIALNFIIKA